jgi:predicted acylesterase/phospholipase RssA
MRSLILAGGGLKVGYQAGCLQVLLDELELKFDHIDAASGGCFNAAMIANDMTGTQIANAWRSVEPSVFTSLNFAQLAKGVYARSVGTADGVRRAFKEWGLDFSRITRHKSASYTFNCFNFSSKRVIALPNTALDEEMLLATVALPIWFPPIVKNNEIFFDAVYCTDGNVGEAVRRGADEIWAIWTVTDLPEYRDGFVAQYFHIIETVANAKFNDEWGEIAAVNQAIANHGADTSRRTPDLRLRESFEANAMLLPPPGRKAIKQHLIKQEVPVHYIAIFNRDRMAAAVEMGVADTRAYARANHLGGARSLPSVALPHADKVPPALEFSETMRGFVMPGESDCRRAWRRGLTAGNGMTVWLRIRTNDLDDFLTSPQHECGVNGRIDAPLLNAESMLTTAGSFNLFVNDRSEGSEAPPRVIVAHKKMLYQLHFSANDGAQYVLYGKKIINNETGFALWKDTTTLFIQLYLAEGDELKFYGSGILKVLPLDFLSEFPTFKVDHVVGPREKAAALARFGTFFFGQAWDVYARWIFDYCPV